MHPRLDLGKAAPAAFKAVLGLENYIQQSGLSRSDLHLIKLRASIINGCAHCVDMHVKESRHDGLSEQWINMMSVWKESPVYSARERALLAWVDALTLVAQTGAPDEAFEPLRQHFDEAEIANIALAIGTINVWNRLAVGLRFQHPIDQPANAA